MEGEVTEPVTEVRCIGCPNGGQCITGVGNPNADLVIVGEAPGRDEVRTGVPFTGPSGQLLNATLKGHGVDRKDVYITNVVACRPTDATGKDAPPTKEMITACSERLRAEIEAVDPKVILTVGGTAAQRVLNTESPITKIAGVCDRSEEFDNRPVIATYHPAFVLHGNAGAYDTIYTSIQRAAGMSNGTLPLPEPYNVDYDFIREPNRALVVLSDLKRRADLSRVKINLSIDTETHGPHDQSRPMDDTWDMFQISDGTKTWAFQVPASECPSAELDEEASKPNHPVWKVARHPGVGPEVLELLKALLQHPNIIWVAHNIAFDWMLLRFKLGVYPKLENSHDTMALALGLTERGEEVGLKYLSRQWLNAPFYEKELDEPCVAHNWKMSWKTGPLCECHWFAEGKYGSCDSWNTWKLDKILPPLVKAEGTMPLVKGLLMDAQELFATIAPVPVDEVYAQGLEAEWLPVLDEAVRKIQDYAAEKGFPRDPKAVGDQKKPIPCPDCVMPWFEKEAEEVSAFLPEPVTARDRWEVFAKDSDRKNWRVLLRDETEFGDPSCKRCMKRRFQLVPDYRMNVNSAPQKKHFLIDMLGMKGPRGSVSIDKDFWAYNPGHEVTAMFEEYNAKNHLLRSYIRGITDDVWSDRKLHPDFLLFGTVTGRLAIHNPPMQTLPKWGVADPKLAKMVRKLIVARAPHEEDEWVIVEGDFSNLELFVAYHYSEDENLRKALTEKNFHTFTASGIFGKPYEWFLDEDNALEAGQLRFLSKFVTFGIAYGRQAYSLAQGELKEITGGSERVAQGYVDKFWNTYPDYHRVYKEWQKLATTVGEITTPMGRKRRWRIMLPGMKQAIMNQAVNFPIQSLASDTCLSALIRLNKELPAYGYGEAMFTVHDSIVARLRKKYVHEGIALMQKEMTSPPYQTIAPYKVDFEVGPSLGEVRGYDPNWDYTKGFPEKAKH
jgi:uracil-DNA glycosylase family 4